MAEILPISQLGNPVLRRRSQFVENIADVRIQQLIDNLISTVQQANGVGIAAPQAAQCDRLFIVASRPNRAHSDD
jgi:peptide deformylase